MMDKEQITESLAARVTEPDLKIGEAFEAIFSEVNRLLPDCPSRRVALERITEAHMWAQQAAIVRDVTNEAMGT